MSTGNQHMDQQHIDWNPNLQDLTNFKNALTDDATENSSFFNIDFGDLGFGFDDMIDIENFLQDIARQSNCEVIRTFQQIDEGTPTKPIT